MAITENMVKERMIFEIMKRMRIKPNLSRSDNDRQGVVCMYTGNAKLQRGFSLMELMVVIAIVGVMAAIAIPSFSSWKDRQAVSNAASSLLKHLKQARNLAMAENRIVRIAFTTNSYTYDDNNSGVCVPCKHHVIAMSQFSGTIEVSTNRSSAPIIFSSRGTIGQTVTVTVEVPGSGNSKGLTLNILGRAYL